MLFVLLLASIAQDLPDGPGKTDLLKVCQDCHDTSVIIADNRTRDAWQKVIAKMADRGADGTDEQYEAIVSYLTKNFGRINVNKATADEIRSGIGFTPEESDAIVKYRDKNGPYKDWRGLKSAIDPAKVDAKKDHIAVQ